MKKILENDLSQLLSRVVLAIVFVMAAAGKISDPEGFAVSISNYRLLPFALVNIPAIILPWIELTTALFLLFGISVRECSIILSALLVMFIIMIAAALFRGLDINCGCFGTIDGQRVGLTKIIENTLLTLLGLHLIFFHSDEKKFRLVS